MIEELPPVEREEEVDPKAAAAPKEADTKKRKREHTLSGDIARQKSKEEGKADKLKKKKDLTYDASDTAKANR